MFGLVARRKGKFFQEVKDFVNWNDRTSLTLLQCISFRSVAFRLDFLLGPVADMLALVVNLLTFETG